MRVESSGKTIEEILQSAYYRVPRFQRPYSWEQAQLEDFWTDVVTGDEPEYFIGSIILYEGHDTFDIVDGQQRLTSITILLAAVRDAFEKLEDSNLAQGVQNLISRTDKKNVARFILTSESPYPYFQDHIQSFGNPETGPPLKPEEKLMAAAYQFFEGKVGDSVNAHLGNAALAEPARRSKAIEQLETIRDKVLGITVIRVAVEKEDDAYVIFETLNTRGLDLSVTDLMRNFLLRDLKQKTLGLDNPKDQFNAIFEKLAESAVSIDSSTFIHHSWISRYDYVPKKEVFKDVKKRVKKQDKPRLLKELIADGTVYRSVREPASVKWSKEERDLSRSLEALNIFGVTQPLPFVLAVVRAYRAKTIKLPLAKRALGAVETFHFGFTAVVGRSSSGGITKMYASHARNVLNAKDSAEAALGIDDLRSKLAGSLPSIEEFVSAFAEIRYSGLHASQKRLVQYILGRMYEHASSKVLPIELDRMTIEHLIPQTSSALAPGDVARIGNLLFVPEGTNVSLGDKSFERKLPILRAASGLWVDQRVLDATRWGMDEIRERSAAMAETAFQDVWSI